VAFAIALLATIGFVARLLQLDSLDKMLYNSAAARDGIPSEQ
jgi:hypothetical protein